MTKTLSLPQGHPRRSRSIIASAVSGLLLTGCVQTLSNGVEINTGFFGGSVKTPTDKSNSSCTMLPEEIKRLGLQTDKFGCAILTREADQKVTHAKGAADYALEAGGVGTFIYLGIRAARDGFSDRTNIDQRDQRQIDQRQIDQRTIDQRQIFEGAGGLSIVGQGSGPTGVFVNRPLRRQRRYEASVRRREAKRIARHRTAQLDAPAA